MAQMSEPYEPVKPQNIIVIHPGSSNLRIGRASDSNPHCIFNAIARKRRPTGISYRDNFLPECVEKTKELLTEMEECRLQVSHTLQSCLQSDGRRRYATPPQQIAAFNRKSVPEIVPLDQSKKVSGIKEAEKLFGDDILNCSNIQDYNLHFPIRRGELNLHANVGGSLLSVLNDLQEIWENVLQTKFKIKVQDMKYYYAVLIIPDIYNRKHLKELTTLLLQRMGFNSCFLIQDHVAATFGSGLGYACVIDVGDQKTSISCVEDGISQANTRVRLDYGGADITQTFNWLLQKCSFPYNKCDDAIPRDALLLQTLKEDFCHVNLDICGSQEKEFTVIQDEQHLKYTLQVGDECIVAPLSLFHTELLSITGRNKSTVNIQISSENQTDPDDHLDAEYLRETGRKGTREQLEQTVNEFSFNSQENMDEDIVVDSLDNEKENKINDKDFILPNGQTIGIDQAVLQSIERCPNDELKRKMYGCILVVGGGMKFAGIGKWLQNRVALQIPYLYRSEQLDIVTSPKEMDPAITTWKGAAIMSGLESAPEFWVTSTEWKLGGLRILREKAPFIW